MKITLQGYKCKTNGLWNRTKTFYNATLKQNKKIVKMKLTLYEDSLPSHQ